MYNHKWFFQGKVIKIINQQTVEIWLDLGFGIWKKQQVGFNRIRSKDLSGPVISPDQPPEITPTIRFLEQNLKGKQVYCQLFKKKDYYKGQSKFYAEIYTEAGDLPLQLKDINKSISDIHRIDGLINFNNIMVSQGHSTYVQFNKKSPFVSKLPEKH